MATYEYSEDQRNYFRGLIDDWKRQNALKTTSESVKRANLDRINQLNYMINLQNNNNYWRSNKNVQIQINWRRKTILQDKIAKLGRENLLGSTLSSQVEANEHVIKQLVMLMEQKEWIGENVYFNPIKEGLNNPGFRFPYAE